MSAASLSLNNELVGQPLYSPTCVQCFAAQTKLVPVTVQLGSMFPCAFPATASLFCPKGAAVEESRPAKLFHE